MGDPDSAVLSESATSSEDQNVHAGSSKGDHISQAETARRLSDVRAVSPTFLDALGLMKITTEGISTTNVPLCKSSGTDTDKNADGSHTSVDKELIFPPKKRRQFRPVAVSSTAKKTSVVKKEHVSKPKYRVEKRSRTASIDNPENQIPVIVIKKVRKTAAPTTDKPTDQKKRQDVKKQKRKASRKATKPSSLEFKFNVKTNENPSKSTSAADQPRFWIDVIKSDFQSSEYTSLLRNSQFTEKDAAKIQRSFQLLCQMFHRPTIRLLFKKTHKCTECNFPISHECVSMKSSGFWTFGGMAPSTDYITPELISMCTCNFTIFHSHDLKPKSKYETESPLPSFLPVLECKSLPMECEKCGMNLIIINKQSEICSQLKQFVSTDVSVCKKFFRYVNNNLTFGQKDYPVLTEFRSCSNLCCMILHRCDKDAIRRRPMPI
nr:MAG: hypothetical protein [Ichnovirus sp.]